MRCTVYVDLVFTYSTASMEHQRQVHGEPRSDDPQLVASPNNSPWEARVLLELHVTFRVIRLLEEDHSFLTSAVSETDNILAAYRCIVSFVWC